MASITLSKELINHFNINDYTQAKHGGQKSVFIATIEGEKFALKIIKVADERFEREVKICKQFSENAGIPSIERIEQFENDTIILEEYIDGKDLAELIKEYKDDENKIRSLLHDITIILKPVWESRYVHRDLKPLNIRIRKDGKPFILDFGIARALDEDSITATGGQPLSWLFASPEQYHGKKNLISYRTDFFCLGIIAYYLYTNILPFGNTRNEIEESFINDDIQVHTENDFINLFCNNVFKINPSERPRKIETFLNLVKQ